MGALVLLVEDDPDLSACLGEVLEDDGYRVAQARDGREALAVLGRIERPALILLDLGLPGLDGRGFRAAQLARPEWARIPTVILTGDRVDGPVAELGAAGGLRKPVRRAELLAAVHTHAA